MSEALLIGIMTCFANIIVVLISGANTRNKLTSEIKTNQAVMNNELGSLKTEVKELKEDVKKHNNYGLQIENINTRLSILEKR